MTEPYTFQLAPSSTAYLAYLRLRRAVFCAEQRLFETTDEDEWDPVAYPIVATVPPEEVVGVVRIYEAEPGVWYGGRLGVDPEHRKQGVVGRGLICTAVSLAHGWGCRRFLALVQEPNVVLFEGMHWRPIEARVHRGRPHRLMEADLLQYQPSAQPRPRPGRP